MDFEHTSNLKLPLLVQNQAGKEFIHNEALIIIDNIVQNGVIDKDLTTPPDEPNINDLYIVGVNAIGTWQYKDNQLAFYDNGWRFIDPREGYITWINDEDKLYVYNGKIWQEITTGSSSGDGDSGGSDTNITELQNLTSLGINTIADSINKLSVKSDYILFDNKGASSRVKVNKATINDTGSCLFQNNYSGRAEFGLIGSDDFILKVSNDGSLWNESFVIDKNNGNINFKKDLTINRQNITIEYINKTTFKIIDNGIEIIKNFSLWQSGSNKGSLDTKSIKANQWYNIFRIKNITNGNYDYLSCLNETSPILPNNYIIDCFINWLLTNASSEIVEFRIFKDVYLFSALISSELLTSYTAKTTQFEFYTGVPKGVNINCLCTFQHINSSNDYTLYIGQYNIKDQGPNRFSSEFNAIQSTYAYSITPPLCITDQNGKISVWSGKNVTFTRHRIFLFGFYLPKDINNLYI